jgi:hypothetical protein
VVRGGANRLAPARRVAALAVGGSDQIFERVNTVWRAGGERERGKSIASTIFLNSSVNR